MSNSKLGGKKMPDIVSNPTKEKAMRYVYRWWAEFEEFGEKVKAEKYFSSHEKMKLYSADYEASNDWDVSYVSGYDKYKVD